jgi:hypothetical protein
MKSCHGHLHYYRKFQIFIFLIGYINVNKLNGPQRLYCDLIDWAKTFDRGWTSDVLDSGKTVFTKLCYAMPYGT